MSELTDLFTNIADSIRAKGGTTETIAANNFPEAISSISLGSKVQIGSFTCSESYPADVTLDFTPSIVIYYRTGGIGSDKKSLVGVYWKGAHMGIVSVNSSEDCQSNTQRSGIQLTGNTISFIGAAASSGTFLDYYYDGTYNWVAIE